MLFNDREGRRLNGGNHYVLHFAKGELPPVKAFWSLTMYNDKLFFAENPLNRYSLGGRDPLKLNPDGSLDLYLQHESPGAEKIDNWLPAPEGDFELALRLYWPEEAALSGKWKPSAVKRAE
jgi:hypothetical protein